MSRRAKVARRPRQRWLHWLAVLVAMLMPMQMTVGQAATPATMQLVDHCSEGTPKQQHTDMQSSVHCVTGCSALPTADSGAMEPRMEPTVVASIPMTADLLAGAELEPVPPPPRGV